MGNIVTSGDISAQEKAAKSLNTVKGVKDKKISNENRSTTPYMTKYERARVLGTRALQIRYVGLEGRESLLRFVCCFRAFLTGPSA
jgi:hypothetical protein